MKNFVFVLIVGLLASAISFAGETGQDSGCEDTPVSAATSKSDTPSTQAPASNVKTTTSTVAK